MCTPFAIVVVANVSLVTQGQVMNASKKVTRSKYRPSLNEEGVLLLALKVLWRAIFVYTRLIKKEFVAFM